MYLGNNKFSIYFQNKRVVYKIGNTEIEVENPSDLIYEDFTIPYIAIYYYKAKQPTNDEFKIPFYFSDFYMRDYNYDDNSLKFKLRYELDGEVNYIDGLKAGDFELNLGKLPNGMHWYSIQIEDFGGRVSRRIFNDIWIVDEAEYTITTEQTYTITDNDLTTYSINKNNSDVVDDMINNRVGLSKLFLDLQQQGYRKCILPTGIYRVNRTIRDGIGDETPIDIPTKFTVDMNDSTFKLHPYNDTEYGTIAQVENLMVRMKDTFDSHLLNGTLEGDFFERENNGWTNNGNGEHNNTFTSYGGNFCSLDNITIKQTTGYNVGAVQNGSYGGVSYLSGWNDDINIINGIEVKSNGYTTSNILEMNQDLIDSKYIVASVWMAMGGLKGNYWDMNFHFYDDSDNFIETIKVYQFTRCRIPNNAKKIKVSFRGKSTDMSGLSIHHMKVCRYFSCNNCHWIDNRTCANPSTSQFYSFLNCDFTRSGQGVTPCEIDLEDGWEQQQDIFIKGCEILENVGTADIIDNSGINHVMENCKNMSMIARYRINGITLRNNENCGVNVTVGWMTGNTVRVYNNKINYLWLGQTGLDFFNYDKVKYILKNNQMDLGYTDRANGFYTLYGNDIIIKAATSNINAEKCNIYIATTAGYIGDGIIIKDSNFYCGEGFDYMKFSFNALDAERKYINCVYNSPLQLISHNIFNSGAWDKCTFKDTVLISPNEENTIGQISFTDCVFEKDVTIQSSNNAKIQFNNCTFLANKTFGSGAETNCEFNNCIGV